VEEPEVSRIAIGLEKSHREKKVAVTAPRSCAITKGGTSTGRIPAKVLLAERARVTAGFAKEVEAVNQ
jgi:hypothetical protein